MHVLTIVCRGVGAGIVLAFVIGMVLLARGAWLDSRRDRQTDADVASVAAYEKARGITSRRSGSL